jgi:protein dithiol:quinone oxidoreductase
MSQQRTALLGMAAVSVAAVGAALVAQYQFNMQPCPWCVLQRVVFLAIALTALLGVLLDALWPARVVTLLCAALIDVLATAGIAAALWQHFVAASSASCNLTLAERVVAALGLDERWPEVFSAYASCKDAAVNLLGVPFEFWSLALFAAFALVAIQLFIKALRGA